MAIGGGGSGGGPVGISNSFTGAAEALEIMGNHIYGYSGLVAVANAETNLINTTSGSYYARAQVLFSYANDPTGDDCIYRIRMNETIIWQHVADHALAQYAFLQDIPIVIPPYTELRLTAENTSSTTPRNQCVVVAGKLFR